MKNSALAAAHLMSRNAGHHVFNFLQFTSLEHVVLVWEYIVAADLKQVPRSF